MAQSNAERVALITQLATLILDDNGLHLLADAVAKLKPTANDDIERPGPTPCAMMHNGRFYVWQRPDQTKPLSYATRTVAFAMLKAACDEQGVPTTGRFHTSPEPEPTSPVVNVCVDAPSNAPQSDAALPAPPPMDALLRQIEGVDWAKWKKNKKYMGEQGKMLMMATLKRWRDAGIDGPIEAGKDAVEILRIATAGKSETYLTGRITGRAAELAKKKNRNTPKLEDVARAFILTLAEG